MKKKSFIYLSLLSILVLIKCTNNNHGQISINPSIEGEYACINSDSLYTEIYIKDSKITFYSEFIGIYGPFDYVVDKDTLRFKDFSYDISRIDCNHLLLKNSDNSFYLEKIDTSYFTWDSLRINPFYIRNAYFRLKSGLITTGEFVLQMEWLDESKKTKDTVIYSND